MISGNIGLCFNSFLSHFFIQSMNQSIGKADFRNINFFRIRPAHYIDINKQSRYDYICTVFPEFVQADTLCQGKIAEFFIIIPQQIKGKWFPFLAFRQRKYFIDIAAGTDGSYMMIAFCFCLNNSFISSHVASVTWFFNKRIVPILNDSLKMSLPSLKKVSSVLPPPTSIYK